MVFITYIKKHNFNPIFKTIPANSVVMFGGILETPLLRLVGKTDPKPFYKTQTTLLFRWVYIYM